jgi:hypothetical protein
VFLVGSFDNTDLQVLREKVSISAEKRQEEEKRVKSLRERVQTEVPLAAIEFYSLMAQAGVPTVHAYYVNDNQMYRPDDVVSEDGYLFVKGDSEYFLASKIGKIYHTVKLEYVSGWHLGSEAMLDLSMIESMKRTLLTGDTI